MTTAELNIRTLGNPQDLVIADLDGTIALDHDRRHFLEGGEKDWAAYFRACPGDKPNWPVIHLLNALVDANYMVGIFSGRSDEVIGETIDWLTEFFPYYQSLVMRPAGDFTPDHELKQRWYEAMTDKAKANLRFVLDDRRRVVDMWRSLGVPCFQVAAGDF